MSTTRHIALDAVAALRERVGEVVSPADATWDEARQAWNLVADQRPVAVVYPRDAGEVAARWRPPWPSRATTACGSRRRAPATTPPRWATSAMPCCCAPTA